MEYEFVDYEKKGRITIIKMNHPERLNSASRGMMRDVDQALRRFMDDQDAWVVIFTGTGRAFCVGMDLKEAAEAAERGEKYSRPMTLLDRGEITKPIIAAINGFALGGGFTLLMCCDLRIATESATLQIVEVLRGRLPDPLLLGVVDVFPHCLALELAMGKRISAQRAYEMGMLNRVVPDVELMPAAMEMAEEIIKLPPLAVSYTLEALRKLRRVRMVDGIEKWIESTTAKLLATEDYEESVKSFVEKRNPVFKGK